MRGWQLLAVLGGIGALAYMMRARWLPALESGVETIYRGPAKSTPTPGSALSKRTQGPTAGGQQRRLAASRSTRAQSPAAAISAGAAAVATQRWLRGGDGPSAYSAGSGLFAPPRLPSEIALSSNGGSARRKGQ